MGTVKDFQITFDNDQEVYVSIDTPLDLDFNDSPVVYDNNLNVTLDQHLENLNHKLDVIYTKNWPQPSVSVYDVVGHLSDGMIGNKILFERPDFNPSEPISLELLQVDSYLKYQYMVQIGDHQGVNLFTELLSLIKLYQRKLYRRGDSFDLYFKKNYRQTPENLYPDFNYNLEYGDVLLTDITLGFSPGHSNYGGFQTNLVTPQIYYTDCITLYCGESVDHKAQIEYLCEDNSSAFDYGTKYRQFDCDDLNYGFLKIGKFETNNLNKVTEVLKYVIK